MTGVMQCRLTVELEWDDRRVTGEPQRVCCTIDRKNGRKDWTLAALLDFRVAGQPLKTFRAPFCGVDYLAGPGT